MDKHSERHRDEASIARMNSDIRQLFSQHSIFTQLLVFVDSTSFKNSRVIGNLSENNDSLELLKEVCKFDLSVDSMES